ncbi:RagB/SusD family nutrient uptake outer membrane protein [Dyadobacter sp. CY323]|uniref:RagB/SusD family nutrient uptake outer membrane protein n=1 Tax=Dyadobacter sp. CY323 TaxID=2907302 RepID=UPI001F1FA45F|nr:RagB/SusD family nutrient uptake outer membrane protein [Dyadobacter sp. CY323]MCE6992935.1 RagB/SusD family nutrient uptake outer membrane protein [Dyadobacter sp. CY323]
MKKVWILLVMAVVSSCYELDTQPYDKVSAGTFWKTEAHALQGIMGVYADMKNLNTLGLYNMYDNLSEIAMGYDIGLGDIINGAFTNRTANVVDRWKSLYDGVQRSNTAIRNISGMDIPEESKKVFLGEARFMRALYYFNLMNLFGGVPIYDESTDLNVDFNKLLKPRNSEQEVRDFILADLNAAAGSLPVSYPTEHYGRATKGAAVSLRGKVYLYNKEWDKAIADFEDVVYNKTSAYGYQLYNDYGDLFKLAGHRSSEMIFAIQNKGGVGFPYGMPFAFYLGTRSTFGSDWNNGLPTTTLADMYENKDGTRFNWDTHYPNFNADNNVKKAAFIATHTNGKFNTVPDTAKLGKIYNNRDPRMTETLVVPYSFQLGWNANAPRQMQLVLATGVNENFGQIRNNRGWMTYVWRKFVPEADLGGLLTAREHTPINFPVIRLADVMLMLAEAYNEAGQTDKAILEVNKVRARVGMPGLNSGNPALAVTGKAAMSERLSRERAFELAGEGHRYFDLKRWGTLVEKTKGVIEKSIVGDNLLTRGVQDRHVIWPIPGQEIEVNPSLKQNPGWE